MQLVWKQSLREWLCNSITPSRRDFGRSSCEPVRGQNAPHAARALMKVLHCARVARFDLLRQVNRLASCRAKTNASSRRRCGARISSKPTDRSVGRPEKSSQSGAGKVSVTDLSRPRATWAYLHRRCVGSVGVLSSATGISGSALINITANAGNFASVHRDADCFQRGSGK